VTYLTTWQAAVVGVVVLLVMSVAIAWLERAPYERQASSHSDSDRIAT